MHGRHNRDAKVVVFAADANTHAAVLRETALGDVETAHDFEPRSERELHLLRRRSGIDEHAIYAIAQTQRFLKGLDMNIARPVFDRLDQNKIGQLDNRRFFAGGGELIRN